MELLIIYKKNPIVTILPLKGLSYQVNSFQALLAVFGLAGITKSLQSSVILLCKQSGTQHTYAVTLKEN